VFIAQFGCRRGQKAPTVVRSDNRLYDIHLKARASTMAPHWEGWDTLIHVDRGSVDVNGTPLELAEGARPSGRRGKGGDHATSDATLLTT
jgi:redox-sensitive bicupin YhaK (pirin superfamily)